MRLLRSIVVGVMFILTSFLLCPLSAQTTGAEGVVKDATTGETLPSVQVQHLPAFAIMPIALVFSIHCFTDNMKRLSPAMFLIPSNSGELKLGLMLLSQ